MDLLTLTHSEMSNFRRCRKQWDYSYRQLIKPRCDMPPLFLGSKVHDALAAFYSGIAIAVCMQQFLERTTARISKLKEDNLVGSQGLQYLQEAADLGAAMLTAYFAFAVKYDSWQVSKAETGAPLIELAMSAMLPTPAGNVSNKFEYAGKLDGVATVAGAGPYLLEHKTARMWSETDMDLLPLDMQTLGYAWLYWQNFKVMPVGIIYNVMIKSQLRLGKKETPEEFTARRLADYAERPEFYFRRAVVAFDPETVIGFGDVLYDIAKDMSPHPRIYRNVGKMSCGFGCSYRQLCTSYDNASIRETNYIAKRGKHEELMADENDE